MPSSGLPFRNPKPETAFRWILSADCATLPHKTALSFRFLLTTPDVRFDFKARPGVSYSLRAANAKNDERPLFVLVDVVDDEPEARWLSVCFYADMVNDPDELGDFVPSGLMGKDACCLNLEEDDPAMRDYILARLGEAAASAAK